MRAYLTAQSRTECL